MGNKEFLLYGGSGHAKVIMECINANGLEVIAVFDDDESVTEFYKLSFLGKYNKDKHKGCLVIAIGDNQIRKEIAGKVVRKFGTISHPSACISPSVKVGEGTVILHHAIIQIDCHIGNHVIINTGASVDHDCKIEDYVHISPQATLCGNIFVGEGTQIGANATIIPGVKIGKWATIGAGAVIIDDIPDYAVVVGNPGKVIKSCK